MDVGRDTPEEQGGGPEIAPPAADHLEPAIMQDRGPAALPKVPVSAAAALLAGLQAGMAGVLTMLAWLGISSAWQQRSFWTAENLMSSVFYGTASIHSGFAARTLPGLSLYLIIYSVLGALVALALRDRLPRMRTALVCIAFAMVWYYVSFHWIWQRMMPLVALLHAERPTAIGHVIFGLWLGRFPEYWKPDK